DVQIELGAIAREAKLQLGLLSRGDINIDAEQARRAPEAIERDGPEVTEKPAPAAILATDAELVVMIARIVRRQRLLGVDCGDVVRADQLAPALSPGRGILLRVAQHTVIVRIELVGAVDEVQFPVRDPRGAQSKIQVSLVILQRALD